MAPEQARGEDLDSRADLFNFGAVLYEMATGRQAFPGKTAAELRADLRRLQRDMTNGAASSVAIPTPAVSRRRSGFLTAAVLAALLCVGAAYGLHALLTRTGSAPFPLTRSRKSPPPAGPVSRQYLRMATSS
jgi:serine/threonine protein kinase